MITLKKLAALIILQGFFCMTLFAQKSLIPEKKLVLKKAGSHKVYYFEKGELIRFKLKGQKIYSRAVLMDFKGDSTIRFDKGEINISEISIIDIRSKNKSSQENNLIIAGLGYYALNWINKNNPKPGSKVVLTSVGMIGSAFLIKLVRKKHIKVEGRYYLLIVKT